jgi:hypothetical protein
MKRNSSASTDYETGNNEMKRVKVLDNGSDSEEDNESLIDSFIWQKSWEDSLPRRSSFHYRTKFYSHLLPIHYKTQLLKIDMISVHAEYLQHIVKKDQFIVGFENLHIFHTDNACLLIDRRSVLGTVKDFIVTIVAHPISQKPHMRLSSSEDLTCGSTATAAAAAARTGTVRSCTTNIRSFMLRPNYSFSRDVSTKKKLVLKHTFRESVPPSFWWNTFHPYPKIHREESFMSKMRTVLSWRPVTVDFLFLLANVDEKDNSITRIVNTAKWEESNKEKDEVNRAAFTINAMLHFGFRILSFGMLCEYPRHLTKRWLKEEQTTTTGAGGDYSSKRSRPARRLKSTDTFNYINTAMTGVKRKAVMRMVYTLDTVENAIRFIRIMDEHESSIKHRTMRSRCFYSTDIGEDLIGRCYVYPNHSLYLVTGSCNMALSTRDMNNDVQVPFMKGMSVEGPIKDHPPNYESNNGGGGGEKRGKGGGGGSGASAGGHSAKTVVSLSVSTAAVAAAADMEIDKKATTDRVARGSAKRSLAIPQSQAAGVAVDVKKKSKTAISLSPHFLPPPPSDMDET